MDDVAFPLGGVDISRAFCDQRRLPMRSGEYGRTCRDALNVRAFDTSGRARGGTRPGLVKYVSEAAVAGWIIQDMAVVVHVE